MIYIRKSGEVPENAESNGIRQDPTGLRRNDDVILELTEPRFIVQMSTNIIQPPAGTATRLMANGSESNWSNWPSIWQNYLRTPESRPRWHDLRFQFFVRTSFAIFRIWAPKFSQKNVRIVDLALFSPNFSANFIRIGSSG